MTEGTTKEAFSDSSKESVKSKERKEKQRPLTKVVIRRLPPTMSEESFLEQISPVPDNDYFYFVAADKTLGQHSFCRAYINFTNPEDIFVFKDRFDNYIFVDSKGHEFPAVVEYAPYQGVPKRKSRKKDPKSGTIETDPAYIEFLASLKEDENDTTKQENKMEFSFQVKDDKKITSTPLLEFIAARKFEKQRVRDERKEERRKRDIERKKQRDEERRKKKQDVTKMKPTKIVEENSDDTCSMKSLSSQGTSSVPSDSSIDLPVTSVPSNSSVDAPIKTIGIHESYPHNKIPVNLSAKQKAQSEFDRWYDETYTKDTYWRSRRSISKYFVNSDNSEKKSPNSRHFFRKKKDVIIPGPLLKYMSPNLDSEFPALPDTESNEASDDCSVKKHRNVWSYSKKKNSFCEDGEMEKVKVLKPRDEKEQAPYKKREREVPKSFRNKDDDKTSTSQGKFQKDDNKIRGKSYRDQRRLADEQRRKNERSESDQRSDKSKRSIDSEFKARKFEVRDRPRERRDDKKESEYKTSEKTTKKYESREFRNEAIKTSDKKYEVKKYSETRREREARRLELRKAESKKNDGADEKLVPAQLELKKSHENISEEINLDSVKNPEIADPDESESKPIETKDEIECSTETDVLKPDTDEISTLEDIIDIHTSFQFNNDDLEFSQKDDNDGDYKVETEKSFEVVSKPRRNSLNSGDSKKISEDLKYRRYSSLDDDNPKNDNDKIHDNDDKLNYRDDKKDPRTERRIRNKVADRPSMAIYQPGRARLNAQGKDKPAVPNTKSTATEKVTKPKDK